MRILLFALLLSLGIEASATRIMPLGDSITYDDAYRDSPNPRPASVRSGYRNYLWYKLQDAHYDVNFVGSRNAGSAVVPAFDPDNEGWPGWDSEEIADITYSKLIANPPDIILLHIGSNDWSDSVDGINNILNEIDRYEQNYHHHIKVILARIINRHVYQSWTSSLNRNIQNLANSRIEHGDDIVVVDMENGAGINYSTDFQDTTHPNNTGYSKMATVWYEALRPFLHISIPIAPTNLQSTYTSDTTALLTWNDNSSIETGYKIYRAGTLVATLGANTTTYTLSGLSAGTTYTYSVVAYNSKGDSASTSTIFSLPEPSKPTNVQTTTIESHSAILTWNEHSNIKTGFKIYQDGTLVAIVGKNVRSYKPIDLRANTTYTYSIVAYNGAGDSDAITITFTTKDDYAWLPAVYNTILN